LIIANISVLARGVGKFKTQNSKLKIATKNSKIIKKEAVSARGAETAKGVLC
jgi:hypothetical protein